MAKIIITGSAVVIRSEVSADDLALVQKHRPETLKLKDENGEIVCAIGLTRTGHGSLTRSGASFVPGENGDAVITMLIGDKGEHDTLKAYFIEEFSGVMANINAIESMVGVNLNLIREEQSAVEASIVCE